MPEVQVVYIVPIASAGSAAELLFLVLSLKDEEDGAHCDHAGITLLVILPAVRILVEGGTATSYYK